MFAGLTSNMDRDMIVYVTTEEPNHPKIMIKRDLNAKNISHETVTPTMTEWEKMRHNILADA